MSKWSVCFVHQYESHPIGNSEDDTSINTLSYLCAHLRLIVPNPARSNDCLQGQLVNDRLDNPYSFSKPLDKVRLEDCEGSPDITGRHLNKLKGWLPRIITLRDNREMYFPLYLSLSLSEKSYREGEPRIRHLLRVMALEALVSSETTFGKNAVIPRMKKLLGAKTDLYEKYRPAWEPTHLPPMILEDVVDDVCTLRNKIGHGDKTPSNWQIRNGRQGLHDTLSKADELREAATSMLALAWNKIIDDNLQETFADKDKMEAHFRKLP